VGKWQNLLNSRMKVVCDVHISFKIVRFFEQKGIEAIHVNNILQGDVSSDASITDYANENDFVVVTKDADFQDSYFLAKKPKKLLKINLGNISTKKLIEILENNLSSIETHFNNSPCLVVLDADFLRVFN
jgi:predicted nuclease of predicted toxin-antitoxin system